MEKKGNLFIEITKYFKDAEECVSLYDCFFKTKDYDFKTLHYFRSGVFIKSYLNRPDLKIYDLETKEYAEIIKYKKDKRTKMLKKTIKLLKSFNELNFDINYIGTEYGYELNEEGEHERDGSFTITITGNKTK
ncbi:hypothetical protein PHG11b_22 [Flavobacterium phage 11b]|uniref:hypothetical protein n=1 Tax=Flavobacterium phage 11b TaxID=294631 RepID=UPI0000444134|nr:hypothetical protein PHG11b_22 [Flavobacterium phage 11b]CAH56649.1 hypothetical protein PHG11b_22 [Flavobacterium phage 11b]